MNPPPYQGPPHSWPPPPYPPSGPYYPPPPYHYPHPSETSQVTITDHGQLTHPPAMYVPGAVMLPLPMVPMPADQPTYNITNYIYHGETSNVPAVSEEVKVAEISGEFEWVPTTATTASNLTGKALVGGHEGWDGSPLWVIRCWHKGNLIPGKLSVRHNAASIVHEGKEVPVQNIEVLCAKPNSLRWVPASNGNVPPGAIEGGRFSSGESLYIGRARHQLSVTPGKIQPSRNSCYISFAGTEVAYKMYDVLCRIC